jgi:enoyl-CoA hydratase/carnithine racemase
MQNSQKSGANMFDNYKAITFQRDGNILTITLNRPDQLNAANEVLHAELAQVFVDAAVDKESDIIVLTGAGRAFSAGGDLSFIESFQTDPKLFASVLHEGKRTITALLDCEKPIICRLNGDAMGFGATIALFCDIIIAADTARIGDPHVLAGLAAGDGGAVIWPQLIGYARAKQYLLSGDFVAAPDAAEMGLINFSVPAEELDALVDKWSRKLGRGAQVALRATKRTVNIGLKQLAVSMIDAGFGAESVSAQTEDHAEALAAMREKRRPVFKGK